MSLDRLNALLDAVADNQFQRGRLAGRARLASPEELGSLPCTRKADLLDDQQAHPPFGTNLTFPLERYTHLNQTSGTTGRTLRVVDTDEDWRWWSACIARVLRAAGWAPATGSHWPTPSGPTSSSGRATRG